MHLEDVIDRIGPERFDDACLHARATAPGTGTRSDVSAWPDDLADVPHDCADLWHDDRCPISERLGVALDLYTRMPCYANVMSLKHAYPDLDPIQRDRLWAFFRDAVAGPDSALADPILYALWVDFFEDPDTVEDAWSAMTAAETPTSGIDRVLPRAGPVPWASKAPLLQALLPDPARHDAIHAALVGSAFDVYGQIDDAAARDMHVCLTPDADRPNAEALAERLKHP